MKLNSEASVKAIKELANSSYFNHLLQQFTIEYNQLCKAILYADQSEVDALRGQARAYYEILAEVDKAKQV